MTLNGFKQMFLKDKVKKNKDCFSLLKNLGYDKDLNQLKQRAFNLSFHSEQPISVHMKDALLTNLDFKTNELVIESYGLVQKQTENYQVLYSFSEQAMVYTYAIKNLAKVPLELSLDFTDSKGMICSVAENEQGRIVVSKETLPG